MDNKDIFKKLNEIIDNASSKYYNYPVSAILECSDGKMFYGVNVETSSPQAGICAERNAIFSAITNGYKKDDFKRIYLFNKTDNIITPCFICRQALCDYCNLDLEIISYNINGESKTYLLEELCTHSFSEGDLK